MRTYLPPRPVLIAFFVMVACTIVLWLRGILR